MPTLRNETGGTNHRDRLNMYVCHDCILDHDLEPKPGSGVSMFRNCGICLHVHEIDIGRQWCKWVIALEDPELDGNAKRDITEQLAKLKAKSNENTRRNSKSP